MLTTAAVAQATYRVLDAGHDLRATVADGLDPEDAADRLAAVIEASMVPVRDLVEGFASTTTTATTAPDDVEGLFAGIVGQLWVADVALSAAAAIGEHDEANAVRRGDLHVLDAALDGMGTTAAHLAAADDAPLAFAPAPATPPPGDLSTVLPLLRERTTATLDLIAESTAEVFTQAATALQRYAPEAVRDAWKQIEERLDLGGVGGKLTALALRALEAALDALQRLVPSAVLRAARERVRELREMLASDRPMTGVARWVLAIDATAAAVDADLGRDDLQAGRLVLAADSLEQLAAQCRRVMKIAAGASVAVIGVGGVATLLQWSVPSLPVILAAVQLLVLAAALTLGRDFVDSASGVGWVRGVRVIVRAAVEPR